MLFHVNTKFEGADIVSKVLENMLGEFSVNKGAYDNKNLEKILPKQFGKEPQLTLKNL